MRPPIDQSIVFTYTDDLEAGSKFFREILELEFVVDQGACHIFRLSDTSFLGICSLPDRPNATVGVTITIVSSDVDGWHKFLGSKGIEYIKDPSHNAQFNVYSSLFLSPDGYRIEIQNFDDKEWHQQDLSESQWKK